MRHTADPELYEIEEDPAGIAEIRLLGSHSPAAEAYFWPPRQRCPITGTAVESVDLSPTGQIFAWTYVQFPWPGMESPGPEQGYGVALVDLPEGPRVMGVLLGADGDWAIGDTVRAVPLDFREDDDGRACVLAFTTLSGGVAS
jgi:uncharacterized OB-fold protein